MFHQTVLLCLNQVFIQVNIIKSVLLVLCNLTNNLFHRLSMWLGRCLLCQRLMQVSKSRNLSHETLKGAVTWQWYKVWRSDLFGRKGGRELPYKEKSSVRRSQKGGSGTHDRKLVNHFNHTKVGGKITQICVKISLKVSFQSTIYTPLSGRNVFVLRCGLSNSGTEIVWLSVHSLYREKAEKDHRYSKILSNGTDCFTSIWSNPTRCWRELCACWWGCWPGGSPPALSHVLMAAAALIWPPAVRPREDTTAALIQMWVPSVDAERIIA